MRSVAHTVIPTGVYFNQSQGVFAHLRADGSANAAPVAVAPPTLEVLADTPAAILFTGYDADGDPLTPVVVNNPAHGQIRWHGDVAHYVPAADFTGEDMFRYRLFNGISLSAPVEGHIQVIAATSQPGGLVAGWKFGAPDASGAASPTPASLAEGIVVSNLATSPGLTASFDLEANAGGYAVTGAEPPALDEQSYLAWDVRPKPGRRISLDEVVFSVFCGDADPKQATDPYGVELRVCVDGFATHRVVALHGLQTGGVQGLGAAPNAGSILCATLTALPEIQDATGTISFRLYFWGADPGHVCGLGKSGDNSAQDAYYLALTGTVGAAFAPASYTTWAQTIDWQGEDSSANAIASPLGITNLMVFALDADTPFSAQPDILPASATMPAHRRSF